MHGGFLQYCTCCYVGEIQHVQYKMKVSSLHLLQCAHPWGNILVSDFLNINNPSSKLKWLHKRGSLLSGDIYTLEVTPTARVWWPHKLGASRRGHIEGDHHISLTLKAGSYRIHYIYRYLASVTEVTFSVGLTGADACHLVTDVTAVVCAPRVTGTLWI